MSEPSPKETSVELDAVAAAMGTSSQSDPLIGKVISDRFRILSPIARGGMGVVYKAEQAPLGRLVAIKILSLKHDEEKDPEFRKRFFLEAATVAKLTHPNTVTVFDYGQGEAGSGSQGIYYIAMELVNGQTLKKALAQEGPFSGARTIHIAKQICRSLREAHRLGVIHRDMKPGNVMLVDRDGEDYVKVLDFGLVKELDPEGGQDEDLTQAGVFMGSPKYMAPEQIQGEHVDGRCDIYAVGVMMYEMLTGRVPFHRDNPMQILMDHVREPVPPMVVPPAPPGAPPRPDIAPELRAIVSKCLEKKKEDRYADMEALLVALKTGGSETFAMSTSQSREVDLARSGSLSAGGTPVSGVHTVGPADSPFGGMLADSVPPASPRRSAPAPAPRSSAPIAVAAVLLLGAIGAGGAYAFGAFDRSPEAATTPAIAAPPADPGAPGLPSAPSVDLGAATRAPTETGADTPPRTEAGRPQPEDEIPTLLLSLRSTPSGAMVRIGDREYGPTPAQVELVGDLAAEGASIEMTFERAGYRDTTITETVHGAALEVSARLNPIRRVGGGGASGGASGRDTHLEGYRDSPY